MYSFIRLLICSILCVGFSYGGTETNQNSLYFFPNIQSQDVCVCCNENCIDYRINSAVQGSFVYDNLNCGALVYFDKILGNDYSVIFKTGYVCGGSFLFKYPTPQGVTEEIYWSGPPKDQQTVRISNLYQFVLEYKPIPTF